MKKKEWLPALDLMEEATHVLRESPAAVIFPYYFGSVPFILGLLYFVADMSRSAFAEERVFPSSAVLAVLFLWMKCWQTIFTNRLHSHFAGDAIEPLTLRRFFRILLVQTILQPSGLILVPVSAIIVIPFAWVYAFYQNATFLGDGKDVEISRVVKDSWTQAKIWPGQNQVFLMLLSLVGGIAFLDLIILVLALPQLIQSLLGFETIFTISGWAVFNTTLLCVVLGLTYLCLDPLVKTCYVLRCFYGRAMTTGDDLRIKLKRFYSAKKITAAILCFLFLTGSGAVALADTKEAVPAKKLDESISKVISKPEYQWRLPRVPGTEIGDKGMIGKFIARTIEYIARFFRWLGSLYFRLIDWIRRHWRFQPPTEEGGPAGKGEFRFILILSGIVLLVLVFFLWRAWKSRKNRPSAIQAVPVAAVPDLRSEDVVADQLPEDEWLTLARKLFEEGDIRLALRALFMGSLVFLGHRQWISIARFKANREYRLELIRRAHEHVDLQQTFSENIRIFERVWYGKHEATRDVYQNFLNNLDRMKALVQE